MIRVVLGHRGTLLRGALAAVLSREIDLHVVAELDHADDVLPALRAGENPLTERESEVLRLVTTGATAKEIARKLSLSAGTVRNYLSHILTKTGSRSRIEAIRKAQEAGWI